jgi:class 3 adenylate cyclase
MSSKISAEELVTLIHAIFTSIDYLAECMGNIWKVETVGDCYIGVVGGPNPCEDHAHRAVVFALSILDNVKRISAKTGVPLKIRVGVHSGSITAAFVGQMLPRYLIFGPDVEIVRQMEAAARPGVVGLTDATAKLLPRDW